MALNWLLHAACTIVLGHSADMNTPQDKSIRTCLTGKSTQENISKSSESAEWMASQMESCREECSVEFQMPLHYPRFAREDYEKMEEWRVDMLLREYGISFSGTLEEKRQFAMGAFLWPEA
ncbi:uncharacterized protein LOC127811887 [Diospyros lotus]|uniref:uncharacterized protein LOC127811887 n=1 Tax=Diospyros lotus TaxID=55363 RepID=UPI00225A5A9A|nr:uncharacterized protein LOC127811887 [Diospyros lotus]